MSTTRTRARARAGDATVLALSVLATISLTPSPIWAAPTAGSGGAQEIDDPKVARRLKTRVALPASTAPSDGSPPPAAAATAAPLSPPPVVVPIAPVVPITPVATAAAVPPVKAADARPPVAAALGAGESQAVAPPPVTPGGEEAIGRKLVSPDEDGFAGTHVPRLKLSYRRFSFVRIGASAPGSTTGAAASEPFDVMSLDYYPVSSFVRFGLSTQYGAESGKLMGGGDLFIDQSFSLGAQLPGHIFTPFAEAFAGGGYMRRMQFGSSVPTVYWQYGVDVGTEIFMAKYAFFSVALGYLHPVNGFTKGLGFTSVYVDTWSLKLGIGL
jgi:hypothetical protein